LAANQFGDLIHNSLEWFGNSDARDCDDLKRIEEAMLGALDQFAAEYLGMSPAPAVKLQIEQARRRLRHVAAQQSARRRAGWHIWKVEASVGEKDQAGIDVDGRRMLIRGRFDRIDHHDDGRWAILDYKTHGHPPRKKHLERTPDGDRWVDLQLPIYRLMIPYLVGEEVDPKDVALAYFNISEKEAETRINEADFTPAEFAAADEVIRDCVRGIRAGRFEPAPGPVLYDDYAMILQSEIADQLFDSGEGEDVGPGGETFLGGGLGGDE
jgi:ATP-dependent helicase/DNAse subunit B